ncbi:MAG: hypothetical protein GX838_01850 [Clostridiaceae bacterium]|nr:hypothetical protein [Clostridiaceae bacterium]
MKKITTFASRHRYLIFALLIAILQVSACAETGPEAKETWKVELILTIEELAQYDGLEGRRAYIAVDGIVYDVTDIPQWKDGLHGGRFQAGRDYSEEIRSESPHGTGMLSRADEVGILED